MGSSQPSGPTAGGDAIVVADGTMSRVEEVSIGAAHFSEEEYTDAQGKQHTGLTAALQVALADGSEPNQHLVAYPGFEFRARGIRFRVDEVKPDRLIIRIVERPAPP